MADKIKGMIYGGLIGDALGAPYERVKSKSKFNDFNGIINKVITINSRYQGVKKSAFGQITDDSEMLFSLIYSMQNNNNYDVNNAIMSYLDWANSKCPFMGTNTRTLFYGVKTLNGYKKRYEQVYEKDEKDWTQSNGCLMRIAPIVLCSEDEYIGFAMTDCKITNLHKICIDGVVVYSVLLKNILMNKDINKCIKKAKKYAETNIIQTAIDDGEKRKQRDIVQNKGWIAHAIYCVFYVLSGNHKTFESAMNETILLDGDTDTNGSIVGNIIGAIYGYDNMMKEKNTLQNIDIIMNCDIETGDMKRPQKYTTKNIDNVINLCCEIYKKNN